MHSAEVHRAKVRVATVLSGMCTLRRAGVTHALAAITLIALVASRADAQTPLGRVTGTATETRRVTQPIDAELRALASRGTVWVAYRVKTLPNAMQRCGGSHVLLDASTELTLMGKVERGELQRLRSFTPECDVDAGSVPLIWLDGVGADDSVRWLATLIRQSYVGPSFSSGDRQSAGPTFRSGEVDWQSQVVSPALTALAVHPGDLATRTLVDLARTDPRVEIRRRALPALADRAGQQAVSAITAAIQQDPELAVKKQAVAALGRLPADQGVPLLIDVATTNRNRELQREAMQWLGRSNDPRALKFFEDILLK